MTEHPMNPDVNLEGDETRESERSAEERRTFGPYRLLQLVGEGGMGEVWLAEQTRPVRRQVALKVIKVGMDTAQVVARFEAERQALALMDHPAIARVFDAGATPQGRPYFVMEYVRGEPITAYCTRHKLAIRDRLDLFLRICEGVQHAHQKGIIHRDLKPSNLLVTLQDDHPVPKIIDFGVAKATTQTLTDRTLHTEFGALVGTPEYMSPEQAEMTGLDVDTRTDVYALGVVLYELLAGGLPFESKALRGKGLDEIRRTIREVDPPRPSTRVTTRAASPEAAPHVRAEAPRLASQLRGDLDWITMKALEKDRTRRYGSASDLAADLRRHLEHQPVHASPPSAVYRARKFVRRHRFGVAAATMLVMLLVTLAATMTVQARRIGRERDRAELEAAKARSINAFLQDVLGSADPWKRGDRETTVVQALGQAVVRIDESFTEQPLVGAAVRRTIGLTYVSLGRYREAEPLLDSALAGRRSLLGEFHQDTIESLLDMGALRRAQGRYADSETIARQVVATRRRNLNGDAAELASALSELATVLDLEGKYDETEKTEEEALVIRRRLYGNTHRDIAESLYNLGTVANDKGDYKKAEALHREALAIRRRVLGPNHADIGLSLNALAVVSLNQGDNAGAEALYKESLDIQRKRLGEEHPEVATVMENLGGVYYRQSKYDRAIELLDQVLALRRRMLGENHAAVARTLHNMGAVYAGAKDYKKAEKAYRESVIRLRATLGTDHPDVASALYNVGRFLRDEGDLTGAERTFREVLGIRLKRLPAGHPDIATVRLSLGSVLVASKRFEEAETMLLEARKVREATFGSEHPDSKEATEELAKLYKAWGTNLRR